MSGRNDVKENFEIDVRQELNNIIEDVAHYLPSQGPVSTFVHHNTLHYFEDLKFFDGIELAAEIFGANAYLPEERYLEEFKAGRIGLSDLSRILKSEKISGEPWLLGRSKSNLIKSWMLAGGSFITLESLRWRLFEQGYLKKFVDGVREDGRSSILAEDREAILKNNLKESILQASCPDNNWPDNWSDVWPVELFDYIQNTSAEDMTRSWSTEHSLQLLWLASILTSKELSGFEEENGEEEKQISASKFIRPLSQPITNIEELINPYLIKFTSAFLDAGLAHLHVGQRERGILSSFLYHMRNDSSLRPEWLHGEFSEFESMQSVEIILRILQEEGVKKEDWSAYLLRKSLILRGWGGLINQIERGNDGGLKFTVSFADFLAVRLLLERSALGSKYAQQLLKKNESRSYFQDQIEKQQSLLKTRAFQLFKTFQILGVSGSTLFTMSNSEKEYIYKLFTEYDLKKRSRIWHKAYEWNFYSRLSSAMLSRDREVLAKKVSPKVQLVCCIDDREESFRRYLEEISPEYETFGTAGFFGVDAEFHSLYERPAPFCPVNIKPTHRVSVVPKSGSEQKVSGLGKLKQVKSDIGILLESNSRSLFRGWLLAVGGVLALIPLSIATLSPRWTHRFKGYLKKILINPQEESALLYAEEGSGVDSGLYTLEEMCLRVKMLLLSTGIIKNPSPLVVITGHGSFSSNNPYRSAYDCGACGGRPGRLNPRVFSLMANRKDVREKLEAENFIIPPNVHFLGAYHNTCTDEVEYFDQEVIPETHLKLFEKFRSDVEIARARNALERCRRFDETDVLTEKEAIRHVEARAYHIAQPRPEYGHATNALCIVGKRDLTRNLFLDRRAFLVSYDKDLDESGMVLASILRAVIPVCMGISLEYFFSAVDNQRYGAGTKLPHNVTSLLGLMTGYCSDLRTGLPAQMVEIHEAVRLLMVIEMEPEDVLRVIGGEKEVFKLINNQWVQLMAYSSSENKMYFFNESGEFELLEEVPVGIRSVKSSLEWVINKKEHLDFVQVSL